MAGEIIARIRIEFAGLAMLGLVSCVAGKGPGERACDEQALERALVEFEREPGAEDSVPDLLDALETACPDLASKVIAMMRLEYLDPRRPHWFTFANDKAYTAEWLKTCADFPTWAATLADLPGVERAPATFEICRLARFGLLAGDQVYVDDDRAAFIAHDWLIRHGVDSGLARRFATQIMSATATEPVGMRRCEAIPGSGACGSLLRNTGTGMAASSTDALDREGVLVTVTRGMIGMVGEPQIVLDQGVVPEAAIEDHMIPSLRASLAKRADIERTRAAGGEWPDALRVLADRDTPFATLVATLRTASDVGYREFAILVDHESLVARLLVTPPRVWTEDRPPTEDDGTSAVIVEIDPQRIRLPSPHTSAPQSFALDDAEALESAIAAIRMARPRDRTLIVRASGSVPVHAVVSTLDVLRSHQFPIATLDLDPPIARLPGRWSDLRVTLSPDTDDWGSREGPASRENLRRRVERALPEIATCLLESDDARSWAPEQFAVVFGITEQDQLGVGLLGDLVEVLPEVCMAAALDLPVLEHRQLLGTFFHGVEVDIELPL